MPLLYLRGLAFNVQADIRKLYDLRKVVDVNTCVSDDGLRSLAFFFFAVQLGMRERERERERKRETERECVCVCE